MKKILLIGCLALLTACQPATVALTPAPSLFPTAAVPPMPIPFDQTQGKPASPTPEPTASQTPEPTLTPLPRFFTNQFDSSLAGWVILQAGNEAVPNITTENGTLRFQMDTPFTWLYALYAPEDYTNVHIETEYVNSALTPASMGLICRYSDTEGWFEYNVSTDGAYNVLYGSWLATGIADYLPVIDGLSREVKQSGEMQHIGLTCSGTILRLFINGTLIRSVDVSSYDLTEGKVGLTASSFESVPIIAVFDSVTITEP